MTEGYRKVLLQVPQPDNRYVSLDLVNIADGWVDFPDIGFGTR